MYLKMTDLAEASADASSIPPGYKFEPHWLDQSYNPDPGHQHFKVEDESSVEVARLDLDFTASRNDLKESTYPISPSGPELLEIQIIDKRMGYQLQGIGTWIVRELESTYLICK